MAIVKSKSCHNNAYAREQVAKLDEWAKGFLFGLIVGMLFVIGVIWAMTGPLR